MISNQYKYNCKSIQFDNFNGKKLDRNSEPLKVLFGQKFGTLLIFAVIIVVVYRSYFLLSDKSPRMVITEKSVELLDRIIDLSNSIYQKYDYIIVPLLCGIGITIFTWIIMYLDSDIPGVNPPSPLSASKYGFKYQRKRSHNLGLMVAISTGLVVSILLYNSYPEK